MLTPYDWQEGIGHRAEYVESRLSTGIPVVAISLDDGVLAVTYCRQSRKIFEVYDRLMFAAMGQQSDIESIRVAAIDFTHQQGFQRSEDDVTIQRVVTAVSEPVKRAFADFSSPPVIALSMFMQVGTSPADDRYHAINYDGDFDKKRESCYLAGSSAAGKFLQEKMGSESWSGVSVDDAISKCEKLIEGAMEAAGAETDEALGDVKLEAGLMSRGDEGHRVFQLLRGDWD